MDLPNYFATCAILVLHVSTSCAAKAARSPFFAVLDSQRALVSHLPPLQKDTN